MRNHSNCTPRSRKGRNTRNGSARYATTLCTPCTPEDRKTYWWAFGTNVRGASAA